MAKRDIFLLAGAALLLLAGGSVSMSSLTVDQIATYARSAGFSGNDLITAVSIAMAESGGNPRSKGDINVPAAGSASFGLWQINSFYHPEYGPDFTVLFDPQTNANAAFAIYDAANGFTPWSTFKNGAYTAFISNVAYTLNA